jgi:hypothetical protein
VDSKGFVIPAQAGIQLINKLRAAEQPDFARYAERIFLLDSRLRGNDSVVIFSQ